MLGVFQSNVTISKLEPTTPNMLSRVATTQCCDMLRWHVAIVSPRLYVAFFQKVKMVCHGTGVGSIKDGSITCFLCEMSPTFYSIAALYSPSDFCINWRYSGKVEEKVRSLQFLTQEITKITFKAAADDLFFLVLTRQVVNLSNEGSDTFYSSCKCL